MAAQSPRVLPVAEHKCSVSSAMLPVQQRLCLGSLTSLRAKIPLHSEGWGAVDSILRALGKVVWVTLRTSAATPRLTESFLTPRLLGVIRR